MPGPGPGCASTARPSAARPSCSPSRRQPGCCPAPTSPYDLPIYATPKVHRDHHIEVAKALYSVPGNLIGHRVEVRADRQLVRVFHRGSWSRSTPAPGPAGAITDAADLPAGRRRPTPCATSTTSSRMAADHGPAVGAYAAALLDHPLPWTKMRQVYALLGLVKRWGPERVEAACAPGAGGRGGQRRPHRPHDRAGDREPPPTERRPHRPATSPARFARDAGALRHQPRPRRSTGGAA